MTPDRRSGRADLWEAHDRRKPQELAPAVRNPRLDAIQRCDRQQAAGLRRRSGVPRGPYRFHFDISSSAINDSGSVWPPSITRVCPVI
jgi:hypothetical protein